MTDRDDKYDEMLFELLKDTKTVPNFFNAIFGFLYRRTDFYHIATSSNAVVGLPEGFSESIIRDAYLKWKPTSNIFSSSDIPVVSECVISADEDENSVSSSCIEPLNITKSSDQEYEFTKSESYNGSCFEKYCWSQTISDVDIIVKLPCDIKKKDLQVEITSSHLKVLVKGSSLICGELYQKCKANDAIWSMDGSKLQIHLDKCLEMWWKCLVNGETELNVSEIDCSRPYEELSQEAQSKIEELQWNQERKKLGLPTSDELALQNTLKKAWNAKGSPFSGPFDPSAVLLN